LATLIRGVIKEELEPINKRLDLLDNRMGTLEVKHDITNKRIEELSLKVEGLELNLKMTNHSNKKEFARIHDAQETLIAVMEAKGILPKVEGR